MILQHALYQYFGASLKLHVVSLYSRVELAANEGRASQPEPSCLTHSDNHAVCKHVSGCSVHHNPQPLSHMQAWMVGRD